ncbi:hypothetical protein SS50377_26013 [Spironucleus salmonicida]|uniref:Uncharacterized protein n=1 Tax=Spironucleus salmonicida TaxID=348837 RepID=A0A9P8RWH6_9EUKA|nr:hypothetical protein SS50377_26013 [Spironucleus salmonicida]
MLSQASVHGATGLQCLTARLAGPCRLEAVRQQYLTARMQPLLFAPLVSCPFTQTPGQGPPGASTHCYLSEVQRCVDGLKGLQRESPKTALALLGCQRELGKLLAVYPYYGITAQYWNICDPEQSNSLVQPHSYSQVGIFKLLTCMMANVRVRHSKFLATVHVVKQCIYVQYEVAIRYQLKFKLISLQNMHHIGSLICYYVVYLSAGSIQFKYQKVYILKDTSNN